MKPLSVDSQHSIVLTPYTAGPIWRLPTTERSTLVSSVRFPEPKHSDLAWNPFFEDSSSPLVWRVPNPDSRQMYPPDDPIWDEVDLWLERFWSQQSELHTEDDYAWLDDIRASWNIRLDDLYDESGPRP